MLKGNVESLVTLLFGGQEPEVARKRYLGLFTLLIGDTSASIVFDDVLTTHLPKAASIREGVNIITATMLAYPDEATEFLDKIRSQKDEALFGSPLGTNEFPYQASVCGVLQGIVMLGNNATNPQRNALEKGAVEFMVWAITDAGFRSQSSPATETEGFMRGLVSKYITQANGQRLGYYFEALESIGSSKREAISLSPFAVELLNQFLYKTLPICPPIILAKKMSEICGKHLR